MRRHAPVTTAAVLGCLLGAACGDEIVSAVDAATDAVIRAADVSYTPTQSDFEATDVQSALDEVIARLFILEGAVGDHAERLDTLEAEPPPDLTPLENAVAELSAAMEANATAHQTNTDALNALANGVALKAPIESVTALQAQVDELTLLVSQLKETVEAEPQCPGGFTEIEDVCVQDSPHTPLDYPGGVAVCKSLGFRLCRYDEYIRACWEGLETETAPEWTAEILGDQQGLLAAQIFNDCDTWGGQVAGLGDFHPFRCCVNR